MSKYNNFRRVSFDSTDTCKMVGGVLVVIVRFLRGFLEVVSGSKSNRFFCYLPFSKAECAVFNLPNRDLPCYSQAFSFALNLFITKETKRFSKLAVLCTTYKITNSRTTKNLNTNLVTY